jgi:hypothetical protein
MIFAAGTGEGLGVDNVTDVNQHPYFKVLGRATTSEDQSVPVGGFQYDLTYTPINPQDATTDVDNNAVYVHAADNGTGAGLGATGKEGDGFLAGDWETVASTLADDDKYFEGRFNEERHLRSRVGGRQRQDQPAGKTERPWHRLVHQSPDRDQQHLE